MRISDRYIGRQVLFGTVAAVTILSLVLVLGNLFKEIRPLLVDSQAPPSLVFRFMFNALMVSMMFSIPWGFLSAVLLVFGRLSSGQEITAFRTAGVSLARLVAPVFVIAAALSAVCLWLNTRIVPQGKVPIKELLYEQAKRDPGSLLRPGIVHKFDEVRLFIEEQAGDSRLGFHLYKFGDAPTTAEPDLWLHAGRFTFTVDEPRQELRLKLYDANFQATRKDEEDKSASPRQDRFVADEAEPYLIPFGDLFKRKFKPSALTTDEIAQHLAGRAGTLTESQTADLKRENTRRNSFSMACLAFACVGVPLGLQSRRKDSSTGLLLSLIIAGVYYVVSIIAMDNSRGSVATIALWAPNAACLLLGWALFRRARYK